MAISRMGGDVNRQRIDKATGLPIQAPTPPTAAENGFKDTVLACPGEVTRVIMKFETPVKFPPRPSVIGIRRKN